MATDTPKIISRADATALGLNRYFTGLECKRGHISPRYTSGSECIVCNRMQAEKWAKANPDAKKLIRNKWQSTNKEYHSKKSKEWRRAHPMEAIKQQKDYRARRKERGIRFPSEQPGAERKIFYRFANREKQSRYHREWRANNPDNLRAAHHKRKAAKLGNGGSYTAEDVSEILRAQKGKCAYCKAKIKTYHVDHIKPLYKGGTSHRRNIQIACPTCNLRKGRKDPIDFAQSQGMLL